MKQADNKEYSPVELWDQLAVTQIKNQLYPTGFKKIRNGKLEVSALDFLTKERVQKTQIISANLVRLYRENLKDKLTDLLKEVEEGEEYSKEQLEKLWFFQFQKLRHHKGMLLKLEHQKSALKHFISVVDSLKPAAPKATIKKKKVAGPVSKNVGQNEVKVNSEEKAI